MTKKDEKRIIGKITISYIIEVEGQIYSSQTSEFSYTTLMKFFNDGLIVKPLMNELLQGNRLGEQEGL